MAAAFPPERCVAMIREAARRPDLDVEILATNAFAFSAQVASRLREGRVILVGDAAHRMTPRGGRGMNTAIADAYDLGWKLAWTVRGLATDALVDSYEAERGPVGRRNVAMSMVPGDGGGTADGLLEDLGAVVRSAVIVDDGSSEPAMAAGVDGTYVPDARPGARAPHAWLSIGEERVSTLDLFGRELVLLVAGDGGAWRTAAASVAESMPGPAVRVRSVGRWLRDTDGTFAETYGLADGGAVLVRPDGVVAWRSRSAPADIAPRAGRRRGHRHGARLGCGPGCARQRRLGRRCRRGGSVMRGRTWISLLDALGYLVWGFGWVVVPPVRSPRPRPAPGR